MNGGVKFVNSILNTHSIPAITIFDRLNGGLSAFVGLRHGFGINATRPVAECQLAVRVS
jgi:hypothetical protein